MIRPSQRWESRIAYISTIVRKSCHGVFRRRCSRAQLSCWWDFSGCRENESLRGIAARGCALFEPVDIAWHRPKKILPAPSFFSCFFFVADLGRNADVSMLLRVAPKAAGNRVARKAQRNCDRQQHPNPNAIKPNCSISGNGLVAALQDKLTSVFIGPPLVNHASSSASRASVLF